MNKDLLIGALALSPLFGLFALFLAALHLRSRHNKAHPKAERTPAQRLRGKILGWTVYGLIMAGCAYASLQGSRPTLSWSVVFFVGLGAFVLGEAVGRRNAQRRLDGKPDQTETVIFF
jgi:succinate-acetate transporter protein